MRIEALSKINSYSTSSSVLLTIKTYLRVRVICGKKSIILYIEIAKLRGLKGENTVMKVFLGLGRVL